MIVFPQAKINLGLNVVARRADGYHDIESLFVPLPLTDALEVVIDPELGTNQLEYDRSGLPVPGPLEADLCYKAVRLLQQRGDLPGLRIHLHKVIPMGAGLGGGSSDGTATLRTVNTVCSLGLEPEELHALALQLGSDCPFFLQQGACIVRGRGERITPMALDLRGIWLVLLNPGIHVSTSEVYRHCEPTGTSWPLEELSTLSLLADRGPDLPNNLEPYVLKTYPVVAQLKQLLQEHGASYASMSGSGSSVFGLFQHDPGVIDLPPGTVSWKIRF